MKDLPKYFLKIYKEQKRNLNIEVDIFAEIYSDILKLQKQSPGDVL